MAEPRAYVRRESQAGAPVSRGLWNRGRLFVVGPEAVKQLLSLYRESFSDIHMEIQDVVAEGEHVVARWRGEGVHTGALFLPQARGRRVSTSGIDMFVIRGGQIAEGWIAWDVFGLLRSLGMPLPGDADWQPTGVNPPARL